MLALAADLNYPLIHIVRRDAQVELIRNLGAAYVLNSSRDRFTTGLQELSAKLHATAVFEAVAGDMTGTVLNAMPPGSTAYLYGACPMRRAAISTRLKSCFTRRRFKASFSATGCATAASSA